MMIIFLILGLVAVYYAARYFGWGRNGTGSGIWNKEHKEGSPFEILKDRYAKGEINIQEYEEMKRVIQEEEKINE